MSDLTLTYGDIKLAIAGDQIPTTQPIAQWVAMAYTSIWNAGKWKFKRVSGQTYYTSDDLTSTGNPDATPDLPFAASKILTLSDDQGAPLCQLGQQEFERAFNADASTGRPEYFAVVNRTVKLWPAPDSVYQFTLSYKRKIATKNSSGSDQVGFFKLDTDFPLWDDHHYILVVRAKLYGLKSLTDPTAGPLQDEYTDLLAAMHEEYDDEGPAGFQTPAWP